MNGTTALTVRFHQFLGQMATQGVTWTSLPPEMEAAWQQFTQEFWDAVDASRPEVE